MFWVTGLSLCICVICSLLQFGKDNGALPMFWTFKNLLCHLALVSQETCFQVQSNTHKCCVNYHDERVLKFSMTKGTLWKRAWKRPKIHTKQSSGFVAWGCIQTNESNLSRAKQNLDLGNQRDNESKSNPSIFGGLHMTSWGRPN